MLVALNNHPAEKELKYCYELRRQGRRACLKDLPYMEDKIYFAYRAYYHELDEASEWLSSVWNRAYSYWIIF